MSFVPLGRILLKNVCAVTDKNGGAGKIASRDKSLNGACLLLFGTVSLSCLANAGQSPHSFEPDALIPLAPSAQAKENVSQGQQKQKPPDFLKPFRIDSFGIDQSQDRETLSPLRLTNDPAASHGMACPFCVSRPVWERSKPSLPAFGGEFVLPVVHKRIELFTAFGGINAARPDTVQSPLGKRSHYSDDNWLLQGATGLRFYLDSSHHFWVGGTGRYVQNLGDPYQFGPRKTHWNEVTSGLGVTF
jgi:hypothetical protein